MIQTGTKLSNQLWRGMICLSLAIGFEEDRARLRMSGAVRRLARVLCAALLLGAAAQPSLAEAENPPLRGLQRQLPNDVELKASYCLAIAKLQYSTLAGRGPMKPDPDADAETRRIVADAEATRKKILAKFEDNISRIQSFLAPKTTYLDAASMLTAYSRGEADYQRQRESFKSKECGDRCKDAASGGRGACEAKCMEEDDLNRRIFECRDLSFLPF